MPKVKPVSLDGSTLEGGGQLVRVALALSAITGIPVHIHNIRANRAPQGRSRTDNGRKSGQQSASSSQKVEGGLKESHLAALQYLAYHCNAYVEGDEVNSREITFIPGAGNKSSTDRRKGRAQANRQKLSAIDLETNSIQLQRPGSVWLIFQAILPFLVFGKVRQGSPTDISEGQESSVIELTLHGGTNVSKSMSSEYIENVLLPTFRRIGLDGIEIEVVKRGWAGNVAAAIGEVKVRVPRQSQTRFILPAFTLTEPGQIISISATMVAGEGFTKEFLEGELRGTISKFYGDVSVEFGAMEDSGDSRRFYIQLVAHTNTSCRFSHDYLGTGKLAKNRAEAEKIAQIAIQTVVRGLTAEIKRGGCVDEFMQDQLVIFQALGKGESIVDGGKWQEGRREEDEAYGDQSGSLHTRTVRWVCETMLKTSGVDGMFHPGGHCQGIGWNDQCNNT